MKAVKTETDVTIRVEVTLDGHGIRYRESNADYRAWKLEVVFSGETEDRALSGRDGSPRIRVVEGYRIKADGTRGARAGRFHTLGWHNASKADYEPVVRAAQLAATDPHDLLLAYAGLPLERIPDEDVRALVAAARGA